MLHNCLVFLKNNVHYFQIVLPKSTTIGGPFTQNGIFMKIGFITGQYKYIITSFPLNFIICMLHLTQTNVTGTKSKMYVNSVTP